MTKGDRKALARYLRWCADELELKDWTFNLMYDTCDDDTDGLIQCVHGRKLASIRLHPDFRGFEPARQRATIAHELIHCHFHALQETIDDDLHVLIGRPADAVLTLACRRHLEYGVDAMATAMARHLPDIAWPKK